MTAITPQQFLDVLMHLESFDSEEQMEPLLDRFGEEQPLLAAFLDEMGGDDFNEDEHEVKFFYGVAIWHTLEKHLEQHLEPVDEDRLGKLQQSVEYHLETLTGENGNISSDELSAILKNHPQQALLGEIFETVKVDEAEFIRPKNLGDMLLYLKMTVDALLPSAE